MTSTTPANGNGATPVAAPATLRAPRWTRLISPALLTAGLAVLLTAILAFQILPGQVHLNEGEVARQNIRAPQRVTYVSQIKTKEAREKAIQAVPDVYDYDPGLGQQQKAKAASACQALTAIRYDFQSSAEQKAQRLAQLPDVILSQKAISESLSVPDTTLAAVCSEVVNVVEESMRNRVRQADVTDLRARIATRFNSSSPAASLAVTAELTNAFLKANETYNSDETNRRRRDAQAAVEPVRFTVEKGEIVVRDGNVVTALDLERLEALGLRNPSPDWPEILGWGLLVSVLMAILALYLAEHQPRLWRGERRTLLLALLILATAVVAKLTLPGRADLVYIFPFAATPMILALLLDQQLALVVTVMLGLMMGPITENSLEITMISIAGGAIGALTLRKVERLSAFLWSGIFVALANFAIILAVHLPLGDADATRLATLAAISLGNGAISAALAATAALPLGYFFGITTLIQLLELAHPSQPLFRRLLLEAPGTYHHSVLVASLAERAAEAVGADTLLARVAAYYHDVGKTVRPYLYIENQMDGPNVHDGMPPADSAQAIISHVTEGAALARRFRLPQEIVQVIEQHHGTRLVAFFYAQALRDAAPGEQVPQDAYRYPGPKPQTRVAALVMLADGVEATARANPNRSLEELQRIVGEVMDERLLAQLDESGMSIKDLEATRDAFISVLQGVYHPRLTYPSAILPPALATRTGESVSGRIPVISALPSARGEDLPSPAAESIPPSEQ